MKHDMAFEENLKPGQKVLVIKGKHAGSVGIVKEVIVAYHAKIGFIGSQKTIPAAHIENASGSAGDLTGLFAEE